MKYIMIPARMESKRLPGKPLLDIAGKPLIQHTWENCIKTKIKTCIVTDSKEINIACNNFTDNVIYTPPAKNGSERCLLASEILKLTYDDIIINCQVDYPNIPIERIITLASNVSPNNCVSLYYTTNKAIIAENPDNIKVVMTNLQTALYFSRSTIPYDAEKWNIHIGIYGYTVEYLYRGLYSKFYSYQDLDKENLEQLQWMAAGKPTTLLPVEESVFSINTQEDLDYFSQHVEAEPS